MLKNETPPPHLRGTKRRSFRPWVVNNLYTGGLGPTPQLPVSGEERKTPGPLGGAKVLLDATRVVGRE